LQGQELAAIVNGIRDRVRARYPEGQAQGLGVTLPDLLPVLHARDAAEAKVAAIGSVNPRAGGLANSVIQWTKRNIARGLGWFVRDQVEYNRAVLGAIEATLEALNEVNRTFTATGGRLDDIERGIRHDLAQLSHKQDVQHDAAAALKAEAAELKDIREHWPAWRDEWEKKVFQNEIHYLRGLAEMQALNEAKLQKLDAAFRKDAAQQHEDYEGALNRSIQEIQQRMWTDMEKVRREYEALIHNELRVVRQKAFASGTLSAPSPIATPMPAAPALDIDYTRFADRFRGSEEDIRGRQRFYLPWFSGLSNVLDIGCGRGEFLEVMRDAGSQARGVDLDEESVALCQRKGLRADTADVFDLLASEPDGSFDGIFASQVIEHMLPAQVPALIKLCAAKLRPGGVLALETPNPECLAIFATHFYLDPTHQRPIPPALAVFYCEEYGLGGIEVHRLAPAVESMPTLSELPESFRNAFFGGLDYALIARKL